MADREQVVEIEQASFPTPWSRQSFLHELMDNERAIYLVYKHKGRSGVTWVSGLSWTKGTLPTWRSIRSFQAGVAWQQFDPGVGGGAWERGVRHLTLEVRKSNIPAQELYKKHGFVSMGIRRQYYLDNKEDAIIMWKGPI